MTDQIRELTKDEIKYIYDRWMIQHFPPDEIKPWKNISRMYDQGEYRGFAMLQPEIQEPEDKLISYALFAAAPGASRVLLDYFAVCEDYRSQGIGSRFLSHMQGLLPGYQGILIETEDIACAQDEEERGIRQRRDAFYERAGVRQLSLTTRIYGVQYRIWNYPFTENAKEPWHAQEARTEKGMGHAQEVRTEKGMGHAQEVRTAKEIRHAQEPEKIKEKKETEACRQDLREIYLKMIPGEKNSKNVQIG